MFGLAANTPIKRTYNNMLILMNSSKINGLWEVVKNCHTLERPEYKVSQERLPRYARNDESPHLSEFVTPRSSQINEQSRFRN